MDHISQFLEQVFNTHRTGLPLFDLVLAMLLAYGGGFLSSFTPCIYPMIPITVGVIGGFGPGPGRLHGARPWREIAIRSSAYLGGMISVYACLGVAAGLTGKIFGTLTNTVGWYVALGVIMSFSSLAMMEVIPFEPIAWATEVLQFVKKILGFSHDRKMLKTQTDEDSTLLGAMTLGASSGIISSPCTTPVLTAILSFIAKTQSVGVGLALMIAFATGLGTLLLMVALFTGALQILPRSGKWMKAIKIISGLLLLAFGDYLFFRAGQMRV